jgi:hypothetical protein
MNLIEQFARHIEFCGFGRVADKDVDGGIFWGTMPDQPDNAVCVFSTDSAYGGSDDGARIQVIVRAKTTKAAYELSQSIVEELADFDGYLAGDGAKAQIEVISASAGLGADEKRRDLYSSNFLVRYCNF